METFIKERADAPAGFFAAEAAGLAWLAAAHGCRIATVIRSSDTGIELERVNDVLLTARAARQFGQELAQTHMAGATAFGQAPPGYDGRLFIGRREMPRLTSPSWGEMYARGRVEPFLAPAVANGHLRPAEADVVRRACDRIGTGAFDDDAAPARIHGDLWAGNVLCDEAGVVLIDPAAHGGHAETDIAMLHLFGLPHLDEVMRGYAQVAPLRSGWQDRIPLHQLHPLAVHAAGHGRAYGVELTRAAHATVNLRT
ncbi:fructosamine kinase family protein [Demequina globuliformis]|uniref:fructosamine kinase family protein n=1 Tax=Demequina globuliformis TaxID=676202 RepID=UPI00078270C3|nr:fructosamine kinase family protein [Demequina globuliformis]